MNKITCIVKMVLVVFAVCVPAASMRASQRQADAKLLAQQKECTEKDANGRLVRYIRNDHLSAPVERDEQFVEEFLKGGGDINARVTLDNGQQTTALIAALIQVRDNFAQARKVKVRLVANYDSALHGFSGAYSPTYSSVNAPWYLYEHLLARKADANLACDGQTPLHVCLARCPAEQPMCDVVKLFLNSGAHFCEDPAYTRALIECVITHVSPAKNEDIARLIVEYANDPILAAIRDGTNADAVLMHPEHRRMRDAVIQYNIQHNSLHPMSDEDADEATDDQLSDED